MAVVVVNLVDAATLLFEIEIQIGLVFVVEVFGWVDEGVLIVLVLQSAHRSQVREFLGNIAEVNLPAKLKHQLHRFAQLHVILARWED